MNFYFLLWNLRVSFFTSLKSQWIWRKIIKAELFHQKICGLLRKKSALKCQCQKPKGANTNAFDILYISGGKHTPRRAAIKTTIYHASRLVYVHFWASRTLNVMGPTFLGLCRAINVCNMHARMQILPFLVVVVAGQNMRYFLFSLRWCWSYLC